jgi:cysteinyl-tRNA synthetase
MTLQLFNTLSTRIEPLTPADGKTLTLYACGPTVYDYGHIGNFRTFLHVDLLRRFLEQRGVCVKHVMNITDVDDKIIRNALAQGVSIAEYTPRYEKAFLDDLRALGCLEPQIMPRATENIPEMVTLIERLHQRGLAYRTEDGSWYFRISGDPEYGKLSKKDLSGNTAGARVDVDEYEKDSASDFAMWKAAKAGEHAWDTALGHGRPGWHIECSAMAMKYLGETLDLHAGGEDLMFPHHENEIAQSESATSKTFARHWMHVRFLLVEGRKMSKSEGNFFTLRDLLLRGHKASAIRFLLLSVPYRHQLNFTFDGLAESHSAVERLRTFRERITAGSWPEGEDMQLAAQSEEAALSFTAALVNDLNTAEARAAVFDLVRHANTAADHGRLMRGNIAPILQVLARFDEVFNVLEDRDAAIAREALAWAGREGKLTEVAVELQAKLDLSDADIERQIAQRTEAKKARNFAKADAIRNDLAAKGILIEDSKGGVRWKRK